MFIQLVKNGSSISTWVASRYRDQGTKFLTQQLWDLLKVRVCQMKWSHQKPIYTQRTFIQPFQKLREAELNMKLSPVLVSWKANDVVAIDDSIVRATTSRRIDNSWKRSGSPQEVRAIGSPTCLSMFLRLISRHVGSWLQLIILLRKLAKSLVLVAWHLRWWLDWLYWDWGADAPNSGLCVAYFDGDIQLPLYDYEEEYRRGFGRKNEFYQINCSIEGKEKGINKCK